MSTDWSDPVDREDGGEVIELRDTGVRVLFTLLPSHVLPDG